MKSVARVNRVVFGLIIVSLLAFSAYCWQLLSQQQRASDLSVAAELVLNRVNTDTVYQPAVKQPGSLREPGARRPGLGG